MILTIDFLESYMQDLNYLLMDLSLAFQPSPVVFAGCGLLSLGPWWFAAMVKTGPRLVKQPAGDVWAPPAISLLTSSPLKLELGHPAPHGIWL